MPVFKVKRLPFCTVIQIDEWNEPSHRYFLGYHISSPDVHTMGLPVVDEFGTFSSPIFIGPAPMLGMIYNVGLTLAHKRNPEMSIDTGWPPLCIGKDSSWIRTSENWEDQLLKVIQSNEFPVEIPFSAKVEDFEIQFYREASISIVGTNAPLLPKQLQRLSRESASPVGIAFSTANRIMPNRANPEIKITITSEKILYLLKNACKNLEKSENS